MARTASFTVTLTFSNAGHISRDGVESNLRALLEAAAAQNEFTHIHAGDDHATVTDVDVTPGSQHLGDIFIY